MAKVESQQNEVPLWFDSVEQCAKALDASGLSQPQTLLSTSLQAAIDGITREQDQRQEAQLYATEWGTWESVVLSLRRLSQTHRDSEIRQRLESFYEGLLTALVKGKRRGRVKDSALFSYLVTMFGVVEAEILQEGVSSAGVGRTASAIESIALRIASLLKRSPNSVTHAPLAITEDAALSAPIPDRPGLRPALRRAFARLAKRG